MNKPIKCLCGALPVIEEKSDENGKLYKYKCPNCEQKELPWLAQWKDCGALQEWNRIAQKKSYRKRTLEYSSGGMCVAKPKILEWKAKKGHDHITLEIYEDNGRFYFGWNWHFRNSGSAGGLGIMDSGFPTMGLLKARVKKRILRLAGCGEKEVKKMLNTLIPETVQGELF